MGIRRGLETAGRKDPPLSSRSGGVGRCDRVSRDPPIARSGDARRYTTERHRPAAPEDSWRPCVCAAESERPERELYVRGNATSVRQASAMDTTILPAGWLRNSRYGTNRRLLTFRRRAKAR